MRELFKRIFINPISIVAEIIIVAIYAVLIILHTDDAMVVASGIFVSATILPMLLGMVFFIWMSIPFWKLSNEIEGDVSLLILFLMGTIGTSMGAFMAGVGTIEGVVYLIHLL